jgi:hypothetical protein
MGPAEIRASSRRAGVRATPVHPPRSRRAFRSEAANSPVSERSRSRLTRSRRRRRKHRPRCEESRCEGRSQPSRIARQSLFRLTPPVISRPDERAPRQAKPPLRRRRGAPQVHRQAGRRSPIGRSRMRARSLLRGKVRRSLQDRALFAHSERLGARESFRVRPSSIRARRLHVFDPRRLH